MSKHKYKGKKNPNYHYALEIVDLELIELTNLIKLLKLIDEFSYCTFKVNILTEDVKVE